MKRVRPKFSSLDDVMNRLKGHGTRIENVFYADKPMGLKFLGCIEAIKEHKGLLVFGKAPKKVSGKVAIA